MSKRSLLGLESLIRYTFSNSASVVQCVTRPKILTITLCSSQVISSYSVCPILYPGFFCKNLDGCLATIRANIRAKHSRLPVTTDQCTFTTLFCRLANSSLNVHQIIKIWPVSGQFSPNDTDKNIDMGAVKD